MKPLLVALAFLATLGAAPLASAAPSGAGSSFVAPSPTQPVVVVHHGVRYRLVRGAFQRHTRRGWVAVAAPTGLVVRRLPRGAVAFRHRGLRHYRLAGVVYRPVRTGFVVVRL